MPIVTLTTDFGLDDEYVGVMKGVLLSVNPDVTILDICHYIAPQDIRQAAFMIQAAYPYFARGTIHVIVVDPGVGTDRRIVCVEKDGHQFLAPDNGILTLIMAGQDLVETVTCVENQEYWLPTTSGTFHGRDIFAPVAGHLSKGLATHRLGRSMSPDELVMLKDIEPSVIDNQEVRGTIIAVDHFGNLLTNISARLLVGLGVDFNSGQLTVELAGMQISGLSQQYAQGQVGSPMTFINSRGYLEIAVNSGSAAAILNAEIGTNIKVWLK